MPLVVHNTLSGKKELFQPLQKDAVGMYVCGPTVYSDCHLGHARAYFTFDVVYRYLKYKGYRVTYVRNITDIDDKIISRANKEGSDLKTVSLRNTQSFHEDMKALGITPPDFEPRATDHIADIIKTVEGLVAKGCAYEKRGNIYYRVRSFAAYGKLSKKNIEDLEAGARVDVGDEKEDPLDFALWKVSKPGEPSWSSPWGQGRPGWHIECTAMSMHHLGETFDIHGGGVDLVFPHHENEIAQSEGLTGKLFVKYWLHNGHVMIEREKMAKSLGNFITIKELLKTTHPEVLRCFALSTHYRSPIDFSKEGLFSVRTAMLRTYARLEDLERFSRKWTVPVSARPSPKLMTAFEQSMDDDFNTAAAIGYIHSAIKDVHQLVKEGDQSHTPAAKQYAELKTALIKIASVLGVFASGPSEFIRSNEVINREGAALSEAQVQEIERLIGERNEARRNKNFKRADEIRSELLDRRIILEDAAGRTIWKVKQ